jgi:hypothetical protein
MLKSISNFVSNYAEEDRTDDYDESKVIPLNEKDFSATFLKNFRNQTEEVRNNVKRVDIFPETDKVCFRLLNALTKEECEFIIRETEKIGYAQMPEYSPSYRSNTRIILNADPIMKEIWNRVKRRFLHFEITELTASK